MVVREDVLVNIKSTADLKGLLNTREELRQINRAGGDVSIQMKKVDSRIRKLGVNVKRATGVFRRFRAELLSVLFFGMMMSRFFLGLLQPAFDLVGIFELWNTILTLTFLDTGLQVLDKFMIPFFNFVTSLSPELQSLIGVFVLFGFGIGSVLSLLGQIGLGIFGLQTLFPGLGAAMIALFSNPVTLAILAVIALIALLVVAWATDFAGLRSTINKFVDVISSAVEGIIEVFLGLTDFIVGVFTADWETAFGGIERILEGFKTFTKGITDGLKAMWEGVIKLINKARGASTPEFVGGELRSSVARINTAQGVIDFINTQARAASTQTFNINNEFRISTIGPVNESALARNISDNVTQNLTARSRR